MVDQMMDMLEDLRDIVKAERDIYKELLDISKRKIKVLVEGKINQLDLMVKEEQKIIRNIGVLEEKREKTATKIASQMNIPIQEVNLTAIQEMAPQFSNQLKELQNEIKEIIEELKEVNKTNGELINQSLDYINMTINMIAQSQGDNKGNYSPLSKQSKAGFFDWKA